MGDSGEIGNTGIAKPAQPCPGDTSRIVTLTVNPAVDMACAADRVCPTRKIRTDDERYDAGGGGINVARVIQALGGTACALTTLGGSTGALLAELLNDAGISWRAIPISGRTRLSLAVYERTRGLEYRFVPAGPVLSVAEQEALLATLEETEWKWLVVSGSLPPGVPDDFYARIARSAVRRDGHVVLDTSGKALRAALGQGLALLKLSLGELEALLGRDLRNRAEQAAEVMALVRAGAAQMVALTLGTKGALVATADGMLHLPAPEITVRSAVGAGDSFLAAMTLALVRGAAAPEALAWGIAAGSAAVTRFGTAQVRRTEVEALYARIRAGSSTP